MQTRHQQRKPAQKRIITERFIAVVATCNGLLVIGWLIITGLSSAPGSGTGHGGALPSSKLSGMRSSLSGAALGPGRNAHATDAASVLIQQPAPHVLPASPVPVLAPVVPPPLHAPAYIQAGNTQLTLPPNATASALAAQAQAVAQALLPDVVDAHALLAAHQVGDGCTWLEGASRYSAPRLLPAASTALPNQQHEVLYPPVSPR